MKIIGRYAWVVVIAATTGCLPQVLHGPRVEDGTSGVISASIGRDIPVERDTNQYEDGPIFAPNLMIGGRAGMAGGDGSPAYSLGLLVPVVSIFSIGSTDALELIAHTSYLDLYVQPVRNLKTGTDFGAGLNISSILAMPYVQYGRTHEDGTSWFTTQGVMFTYRDDQPLALWAPSVSKRQTTHEGGRALTFTGGGAVGRASGRTEILVVLSVTAEFGLKKAK